MPRIQSKSSQDSHTTKRLLHFCGHMISQQQSSRFPSSNEALLQSSIDSYLSKNDIAEVFGSLAAGADIMIVESAIKYGSTVHLVFPYPVELFVENSVRPSGEIWVERFDRALQKADSTTVVYTKMPENEVNSYAHCTQVAMGLAILKAASSDSIQSLKQLALWDEQATKGVAGSYPDMLRWQSLGLKSDYLITKFESGKHINTKKGDIKIFQDRQSKDANPSEQINLQLIPGIYAIRDMQVRLQSNNILDFILLAEKNTNESDIVWDLDSKIFGKYKHQASPRKHQTITPRAAAMFAFYYYQSTYKNQDFEQFSNALTLILSLITDQQV
jgi:hypothetical protein